LYYLLGNNRKETKVVGIKGEREKRKERKKNPKKELFFPISA